VLLREIAETIGRSLDVLVVAKSPMEAAAHFGWAGYVVGVDYPASNERTRASLV
jgi:hypothetical protein